MSEDTTTPADPAIIAVAGAMLHRASCLFIPFIPIKSAGRFEVNTEAVVFEPILHYKLVAKPLRFPLAEVVSAEAIGQGVEVNFTELVAIGKRLRLVLRSQPPVTFRSIVADDLAAAVNFAVTQWRAANALSDAGSTAQSSGTVDEQSTQ